MDMGILSMEKTISFMYLFYLTMDKKAFDNPASNPQNGIRPKLSQDGGQDVE
jgi:hypothetical protein